MTSPEGTPHCGPAQRCTIAGTSSAGRSAFRACPIANRTSVGSRTTRKKRGPLRRDPRLHPGPHHPSGGRRDGEKLFPSVLPRLLDADPLLNFASPPFESGKTRKGRLAPDYFRDFPEMITTVPEMIRAGTCERVERNYYEGSSLLDLHPIRCSREHRAHRQHRSESHLARLSGKLHSKHRLRLCSGAHHEHGGREDCSACVCRCGKAAVIRLERFVPSVSARALAAPYLGEGRSMREGHAVKRLNQSGAFKVSEELSEKASGDGSGARTPSAQLFRLRHQRRFAVRRRVFGTRPPDGHRRSFPCNRRLRTGGRFGDFL